MEIKLNILRFLNILLFLYFFVKAEELSLNQDKAKTNKGQPNPSELDQENFLGKNYDLFLPKYDFQRPYKFRKDKYNKLTKFVSDYKRKQEVPKDAFIMGDDLIQEYEDIYKKEMLYRIINKEVNLEEVSYDKSHEIYAYPDLTAFRQQKPKFILNDDHPIKNYDSLGNFLKFSHKKIEVVDKPICIATMVILNVANIRKENIIIKSIRSDLFQAAIFIPKGKEMPHSYNQKNLYPKILVPDENFSLQVIILPDMVGKTVGNIYFELSDNKVIVFPVEIKAVENIYKVSPIYVHNWPGSKLFISQVNLYNPHPKTLIIKEVINSFSSINLLWPNGQPVSSNHTSISSSMLEISAKSTKNILQINFYKDVSGVEYGLLQLKTDRDTLIIPVVVGVEVQVIRFFPNLYNFGVIDVNRPVKRLIPISISNLGITPVQIKIIYSTFEENLIEFIPNSNNLYCNHDQVNSGINSSFNNEIIKKNLLNTINQNLYMPGLCILNRIDNMNNFGFLMIDPSNYREDLNSKNLNKKTRGSILVQTNYTDNPFIELTYEYYLDKNTISFEKEPELFFNNFENSNRNAELSFSLKGIIKAPFYTTSRDLWTNNIQKENGNTNSNNNQMENQLVVSFDKKELINVNSPNPNSLLQEIRELNLNVKINNLQTFQNKKNYFFPVKLNLNMVTLFPVKLYDKSIELHFCDTIESYKECLSENYSAYKSINYRSQTMNVDFGLLSTSEAGKKYFNLINDNSENIKILKIDSTSPLITLAIESIEDIYTNKKIENHFNKNFEIAQPFSTLKKKNDADIPLIIPSESYLALSLNVNSNDERELNGIIILHFENNVKLTINVNSKFLKGNLNITPSTVRFEPAFPGLFQSKLVSSKSSYNIPINIQNIKSLDQRIVPIILTNSIISNNRTEILKIIFDPSKVEIEENFMRGDFITNSTSKYLTYKELYLWKEKQKLWEILGSQGRTEINSFVKIKTNIQTETVNVRGFLTKPSLVKKDEVEFGLVQLGESNTTHIEVFNPSDEPMTIQVLLAPEDFADIHNNSIFFNHKQNQLYPLNKITILECSYFNISNFIDQTSQNFTQNFINNRFKKRIKKKNEELVDSNINSILLEEEISNDDINARSIQKIDFLRKLFLYTSLNTRNSLLESERIICNTNFFKKNEIIFNNNKELIEKIFSEEFIKEINIIKRMTERTPPSTHRIVNRENYMNIFERLAYYLKIFFKTEIPHRKKRIEDNNLNAIKQEFFLPKSLSSQVFIIKPHQKTKIGPIVYSPSNNSGNSTATLFIKNNLTLLYPIKLKGYGGSGVLNFFLLNNTSKVKGKIEKVEEKIEKLYINIDDLEEFEKENNEIKRVIKIKNTGNLPVKVQNITVKDSGCEGYGIKLSRCAGFLLNPNDSIQLTISITPDFNFYYLEKEILFETTHQITSIKILISITNEILSAKNKLFSHENFNGYGLISLFGSLSIIMITMYILQSENQNKIKLEIKNEQRNLSFVSAKEIIEKKSLLTFENLFIKAYRKNNRSFYEEFLAKYMDAPNKNELENLILDKKKKLNIRNSSSTGNNESKQIPKVINESDNKNSDKTGQDQAINEDKKLDQGDNKVVALNESDGKDINNEDKDKVANKSKTVTSNKNLTKKVIAKKDAQTTKKTTVKKPVGITIKGSENAPNAKKEEEKKTLHNILNTNQSSQNSNNVYNNSVHSQNLLPGSIYEPRNKYDFPNSVYSSQINSNENMLQNKPNLNINNIGNVPLVGKEELNNIQGEYYHNQLGTSWNDGSYYPHTLGFWPKNYPPTSGANYSNYKRFGNQTYDFNNASASGPNYSQGKLTYNNSFNYSNTENRSIYTLNPTNPTFKPNFNNSETHPTPLNTDAPSFNASGKLANLGSTTNNNTNNISSNTSNINESNITFVNKSRSNDYFISDSKEERNLNNDLNATGEKTKVETAFNTLKNIDVINDENKDIIIASTSKTENEQFKPKSDIPNIKEQFLSFAPGFFTQEANKTNNEPSNFLNLNFFVPNNDTENNNKKTDLNNNLANNINTDTINDNLNKENDTNKQDNLMGNFKMIDFTNYFNQGQQENNIGGVEHENQENSDNEDLLKNNFDDNGSVNENEYEYNKYRSDREKIIEDSGTEDRGLDIKFNFNSIFGQNNMKLIYPSYNDFNTDTEEVKQNFDGNKPYFDKNLFFSFDSVYNENKGSGIFNNNSTNLFSGTTKSSSLLSELRDDETNENAKHNEWENNHNKLDDVAEIEDDDDEEDPIWNNDTVDISKEGFFDASGNYKLKQMDFNFNLDFNSRK